MSENACCLGGAVSERDVTYFLTCLHLKCADRELINQRCLYSQHLLLFVEVQLRFFYCKGLVVLRAVVMFL